MSVSKLLNIQGEAQHTHPAGISHIQQLNQINNFEL